MATDPDRAGGWTATPPARRNNRATRWYHGANLVVVGVLLGTGWWLRAGHEGEPSVLSDLLGAPDTEVHRSAGWVLLGLAAAALILGARGTWTFLRETVRADRGDLRWFRSWPRGAVTGRFHAHRGHFDPGQRIANVAFVATLATLVVTGVAMTTLSGGPTFATMVRVHRGATYVLTALVAGHLLLVSGLLPGYRGAWRAMVGGRVRPATAERLWPADQAACRPARGEPDRPDEPHRPDAPVRRL